VMKNKAMSHNHKDHDLDCAVSYQSIGLHEAGMNRSGKTRESMSDNLRQFCDLGVGTSEEGLAACGQ